MMHEKEPSIKSAELNGIPVIRLSFGPYEADICQAMGANCIRLSRNGVNALRTPPDFATFRANPNVYGLPLLFPPNRIGGGAYTYRGRTYRFPVNEPDRGHHIHGVLSSSAFSLAESHTGGDFVSAAFHAAFDPQSPYLSFPHAFCVRLLFRLDVSGWTQELTLSNTGGEPMPAGLGFHTAFALPFLPGTSGADYRLCASVGEEICLDPVTILPTGQRPKDSDAVKSLCEGSLTPAGYPISYHYSGRKGEITLIHLPTRSAVRYLPDPRFSFLMLWNGDGHSGFVCPEPQTWQVDAPNVPLPPEKTGFMALAPGEAVSLTSHLIIDLV